MKTINKQQTGFKFGKYRLEVTRHFGEVKYNGRTYKLLGVKTHEGLNYLSLRLYNGTGKFIKQLLIEPALATQMIFLFKKVPVLDQIVGQFISDPAREPK